MEHRILNVRGLTGSAKSTSEALETRTALTACSMVNCSGREQAQGRIYVSTEVVTSGIRPQ